MWMRLITVTGEALWRFSDLLMQVAAAGGAWLHQGGRFGLWERPKSSTLLSRPSRIARLGPFELI
jgi:hypothetical protein